MRPHIPVRFSAAIVSLAALVFSSTAFARDAFFKPVIADLDVATPGLERVVVTDEGSISAFSYEGSLLANFPVWLDGFVPVSSPLIGDVVGDGQSEIVVVGRSDQNVYKLFTVTAGGQVSAQADIAGEVYFDPVIVSQNNAQHDDVVVASINGNLQRFRVVDAQLVGSSVLQLGPAVGISAVGGDVVVNYPETNSLEIYNEQNGVWARRSVIAVPNPILYPVTVSDDGKLLGVTRNGKLISVAKVDGQMTAGFPVDLSSSALGSVTLAEVNADNAGKEILVNYSDGTAQSLRTDGTVLQSRTEKNFMSLSFDAEDALSRASFAFMSAYSTPTSISQQNMRVFSYLSRIRMPTIVIAGAEINLTISGAAQASGATYSLGTVPLNDVRDVTILIENSGESALQLSGAPTLSGDAASFSITTQPRLMIPAHGSSQLVVHFTAQSGGVKIAQITFASNDADEAQYILNLRATVATTNLVRDGDFEAVGINANNWRAWSAAGFSKSSVNAVSGTQSMFISAPASHSGIQQLSVPVVAGHKYRYSIKYKLLSGTFNTWLGIKTSNSDFEKKMATYVKFSDTWQTYSREFVVPANFVNDFRILASIKFGEGYIDDVTLEEIPNVPSPLVIDGDMEQEGLASWMYYGQPQLTEKSSAQTHSGTQSMHLLSQANFGFQQVFIPVVAGHQYRLRLWYKNDGGTFMPRIGTNSSNEDFEFPVASPNEPMLPNTNGQWIQYERTFTGAANYVGLYRLVFAHSSADFRPPYRNLPQGEVWIDDVSIEEVSPQ